MCFEASKMHAAVPVSSSAVHTSYNLVRCLINAAGIAALQPTIDGVGRRRLMLYDLCSKRRDVRPFVNTAVIARLGVEKRKDK